MPITKWQLTFLCLKKTRTNIFFLIFVLFCFVFVFVVVVVFSLLDEPVQIRKSKVGISAISDNERFITAHTELLSPDKLGYETVSFR